MAGLGSGVGDSIRANVLEEREDARAIPDVKLVVDEGRKPLDPVTSIFS